MESIPKNLPKNAEVRLNHCCPGHPLHGTALITANHKCRQKLPHHGGIIVALKSHNVVKPYLVSHIQCFKEPCLGLGLSHIDGVHGAKLESDIHIIMNSPKVCIPKHRVLWGTITVSLIMVISLAN